MDEVSCIDTSQQGAGDRRGEQADLSMGTGKIWTNQAPYPSTLDGWSPDGPPGGNQRHLLARQGLFLGQHQQGEPDRVSDPGGAAPKGGRVRCEGEAVARQGETQFPRGLFSPAFAGACFKVAAGRLLVLFERGARSVESHPAFFSSRWLLSTAPRQE